MWSALLQGAGAEPTVWKMVSAFGPNWKAARDLCRRFADSTPPERDALRAARATRDARSVRGVRAARDAWSARDARAVRAVWVAWDSRAARDAWEIWEPWVEGTAWDRAAHDRVMALSPIPAPTPTFGSGRTRA
jgi:hypothetical protein